MEESSFQQVFLSPVSILLIVFCLLSHEESITFENELKEHTCKKWQETN